MTELIRSYDGPHDEDSLALFGEFRHLWALDWEEQRFWVPEDNSVLRALQYVSLTTGALRFPWRAYCWNDTQGCCEFGLQTPQGPQTRRACRTRVEPGMRLIRLPKGGQRCAP